VWNVIHQRAFGRCLSFFVLCATLAYGQSVQAQEGLAAGPLNVSPRLRLETGYDSNAFYRAADATRPTAVKLDVVPSVIVATRDASALDWSLAGSVRFEQYVGGEAGTEREALRQMSGVDVNVDTTARFNPNGLVSIAPSLLLQRSNDPVSNLSGDPWRNLYNQTAVEIGLHPGGANTASRMGISGYLRGFQRLYRFNLREQLNRDTLGGELRLNWNILPKSAFFVSSSVESINYKDDLLDTTVVLPGTNPDGSPSSDTISNANANATPVRVSGGFDGLLTRRFGILVRGGYGIGNYDLGESISTPIGQLQATVYANPRTSFKLGASRDFADSNLGNFVSFNRVYTGLQNRAGDLTTSLDVYLQFSNYALIENDPAGTSELTVYSTNDRNDTLVGGYLDMVYSITPWFGVGANYRLDLRDSNFSATSAIDPNVVDPASSASFTRHAAAFILQFGY